MALVANLEYRKLKRWSQSQIARAKPIGAELFRTVGPRYTAPAEIESGIGGYRANGRWCRLKIARILYLSVEPETALRESNEHARRRNLPLWGQMPKVVIAMRVDANLILDLNDSAVIASLPVSMPQLFGDWRSDNQMGGESISQALGRAAVATGWNGLRVPSAVDPSGVNIVLFNPNSSGATARVLNPELLEKLGEPTI